MAIREGRCANCGSIINVDSEKKNYCVFCWAPVDAEQAMALAEDAGEHVFANQVMEKPAHEEQDEVLALYRKNVHAGTKAKKTTSSQPVKRKTEAVITPAERVAQMNAPIPEVKVNKKNLAIVLGSILLIAALAFGIGIPVRNSRDAHREQLHKEISAAYGQADNQLVDSAIKGFSNDQIQLVFAKTVDERFANEQLVILTKVYESVYGEGAMSKTSVNLSVFSPQGSYKVKPQGTAVVVESLGK